MFSSKDNADDIDIRDVSGLESEEEATKSLAIIKKY